MSIARAPDEWRKPSRSDNGGNCVEVRFAPAVGVRDTKDRRGGQLTVAPDAWRAALAAFARQ